MPIEVGIWRLGKQVEKDNFLPMPAEEKLEAILAEDISILDPNLLLMDRQVPVLRATTISKEQTSYSIKR